MSKKQYQKEILAFLVKKTGDDPIRPRKLARQMGVADVNYGDFRAAYKQLRAEGRLIFGSGKGLTFPNGEKEMVGRFRSNPRGFGFVVPEDKTIPADLFVPAGCTGGAQEGDLVRARMVRRAEKAGQLRLSGEVIKVVERGNTNVVGTLQRTEHAFFVVPDGRRISKPVIIRDVAPHLRRPGTKVKVEITQFPEGSQLCEGVIVESFGDAGVPRAEISSVMASFGIPESFPEPALQQADQASKEFVPDLRGGRVDLTNLLTVTIDPDTARDFDDAISLEPLKDGGVRLYVHIADVAAFVTPDSPLDKEARRRGFSVYFPRFVVPMLPEALSNGICSLQEGVKRYAVTAIIDFDEAGVVLEERVVRSLIESNKRLTYLGAQQAIDGEDNALDDNILSLLARMDKLARAIEERRQRAGMIHLDLPEVELKLGDQGQVLGAEMSDNAYTHTIIEMFMVEANEAVARILNRKNVPFVRRIHPAPDEESIAQLVKFVSACGYNLAATPTRSDLARLVANAAGKPESYALNLAVLRSFQRASYDTAVEGHFALAGDHYTHFTSPIRRYPDLLIHRDVIALLTDGRLDRDEAAGAALKTVCDGLNMLERRAQSAEMELRLVLVLLHLQSMEGALFEGVVTGVTDFGLFVQHPAFLIEGLIRLPDLGDDWWEVSSGEGKVRGSYTGKTFGIGTRLEVRIDGVNISLRQLELSPSYAPVKRRPTDGGLDYWNHARTAQAGFEDWPGRDSRKRRGGPRGGHFSHPKRGQGKAAKRHRQKRKQK